MNFTLAFDASGSVRTFDENGNLHVKVSHLTKAQIRPYRGNEIPNWERLRLDPMKVYQGYCPPEELSKPETVQSTNGIPIQLDHHPDYPDDPALMTRVGSTGTDGAFNDPYLDNSLHFTVQKAIDRIKDGSMRELSLAYRYDPDFTPGKTPEGEAYDFVMRNISANHVALVELGRAGRDVLVEDSSPNLGAPMEVDEKKTVGDDNTAVEKKEVALADTIKSAAEELTDLHTDDGEGHVEDVPAADEDDEKVEAVASILDQLNKLGLTLEDLAKAQGEAADSEDGAEDDGETAEDGDKEACVDDDELIQDALAACGYDEEPPEIQRAFAEGVRYGEKKEKEEPKKLDEEHESEGERKAMGQDAAMKAVERRIMARFAAIDECKPTLGRVKVTAFDSAEGVYLAALKAEGFRVKGMDPRAARAAYRAFRAGKSKAVKGTRSMAQDAALKKQSSLAKSLSKIRVGD